MRPADTIASIRYFGLCPIVRGAWHRGLRISGLLKRKFPQLKWDELDLSSLLKPEIAQNDLKDVLAKQYFFPVQQVLKNKNLLCAVNTNSKETIRIADNITKGIFRYFSHEEVKIGIPVQWHTNPFTNAQWPSDINWCDTNYFSKEYGDIKLVWEVSRFSWVYDLVRAYALTGEQRYAEVFWQLCESWLENNQPNTGVNWSSGQECALRLMAWCFGLFAFLNEKATTQQRIEKSILSFFMHCCRIENFISHAIRQKTNHALTEAAGLYTVGILFPFLQRADKWEKLGKRILEHERLKQIYEDGSYIQHSMNYHRLMLQTYLWSMQLGSLNSDEFSEELKNRILKSVEFLYQMQDVTTGRLPNYGANDGALILPLNSCDYLDYRPAIQSCWYQLKQEKLYGNGPWDEDLVWLFGLNALKSQKINRLRVSSSFDSGGYYTFRSKSSWAMIRCHSYRDRPGHIDPLHLDLWADGINLLRDCGSYSYFAPDEPKIEAYFKSIRAHNTIIVDDCSPGRLVSRFIYLPWPKAELLRFKHDDDSIEWEGVSFAYNRKPWKVTHFRKVMVRNDYWEIEDKLIGSGKHGFELRWHLPENSAVVESSSKDVKINLPQKWYLQVACSSNIAIKLNTGDEDRWESLYYHCKQPTKTLLIEGIFQMLALVKTIVRRREI